MQRGSLSFPPQTRTAAMSAADDKVRTASSQLRALSRAHPGIGGVAREIYANAEGYASDGVTPFCNGVLVDEENPDDAYIYFLSHSDLTNPERVFDLGHLDEAASAKHRKFNLGTYIAAGKLCRHNKEGMIVAHVNPHTGTGLVMRAYIDDEGYVSRVLPVELVVDASADATCRVSLLSTPEAMADRNRIEKLWLGTRWDKPLDIGTSHLNFCAMLWSTFVAHAYQGKAGKQFCTTMFLYTDLKTTPEGLCFLESSRNDIKERDTTAAYGFRNTIREHFLPHVNSMPLVGSSSKKRTFQVMSVPINLSASGDDEAPWIANAAELANRSRDGWKVIKAGYVDVPVKFVNSCDINSKRVYDNFKDHSRSIVGTNAALPVGAVVTHFDKVISKTPFGLHKGECFQVCPEAATHYEPIVNGLLKAGELTFKHTDSIFVHLLGVPNAKVEMDPNLSEEARLVHRAKNAEALGFPGTDKGFEYLSKLIIRPFRKCRKLVDKKTLTLDETRSQKFYLTRAERSEGEANLSTRMHLATLLGLDTIAIVQVGNLEQPIDKERLADDGNTKQLYQGFMRALLHHTLANPTPEVAAIRKAFLEGWEQAAADQHQEDADVAWIKAEVAKRDAAREKAAAAESERQRKEKEAAQKRAAEEEAKRKAAEERAAAGARMSARLAAEAAIEKQAAEDEKRKAAAVVKAVVAKEKRRKEKEAAEATAAAQKEATRKAVREAKSAQRKVRGEAATTLFGTGVVCKMHEFHFPEERTVEADSVNGRGDFFRRDKVTGSVEKFNEAHQTLEAAAYAIKPASLKPGKKRKLEHWVTGKMAKKMLKTILSDGVLVKAIGAEYQWGQDKNPVGEDTDEAEQGESSDEDEEVAVAAVAAVAAPPKEPMLARTPSSATAEAAQNLLRLPRAPGPVEFVRASKPAVPRTSTALAPCRKRPIAQPPKKRAKTTAHHKSPNIEEIE